jgi:predicted nucleic acid-binding protein
MGFQTVYWDANVFHALFGKEAGREEVCAKIESYARQGILQIYTSTATFVECVWIKGVPNRLEPKHEALISKYFQHKFLRPIVCDRQIAESARSLIWQFYPGLKPKDAIHLASALFIGVDVLQTYDNDLLKLSGKVGNPPLKIEQPIDPFPPPPPPTPPPTPEPPKTTPSTTAPAPISEKQATAATPTASQTRSKST